MDTFLLTVDFRQEIVFLGKINISNWLNLFNMNISLAFNLSVEVFQFSKLFNSINEELKKYFENKEYGDSLKELYIGVVCISPEFEMFFKLKKPKYTLKKETVKENITYKLNKAFQYESKLHFDELKRVNNNEKAKEILRREIINSFIYFEQINIKLKDFDIKTFKEDLEFFLKNKI